MTSTPGHPGPRREGRRRARESALQMLYHADLRQVAVDDVIPHHGAIGGDDAIVLDEELEAYAVLLARGAWDDRARLDEYIAAAALNWRVERLAVVDRLVLRLAIHELLAHPETPPRVVIDEAIELARIYSGDEASRFVNGVIDGVYRRLKDEHKIVE